MRADYSNEGNIMIMITLGVAALLTPLAFWLAAPRRVPAPVKARSKKSLLYRV